MKGRVDKWIPGRGFGFIESDAGGRFFVHASEIVGEDLYKNLVVGEDVQFELKPALQPGRPPMAANVRRLNTIEPIKEEHAPLGASRRTS